MLDSIFSRVLEKATTIIENKINLVGGVEEEVRNLSAELEKVRNLLDDADRQGIANKSIKDWLTRLEDKTYEMEDVLDEWEMAALELNMEPESNDAVAAPPKKKVRSSFMASSFKKVVVRHDIAKKIKNVKEQLDEILKEKDRYNFLMSQPTIDKSWRGQSTSFVDLAEVHGRDSDSEILLAKLMADGGRQDELGIQVLSIVGVGGLGKTTVAQLVYNDSHVKEHFELKIWVCVSDAFDEVGIAKRIFECVKKERAPDTNNLEMLLQSVRECVGGKKFLLVLDDVWTEDYAKWEPLKTSLKCGGAGSKILVTTRNEKVAKIMGTTENDIHRLGQLSNEDCWLLLCRMALFERNEEECKKFQDIGRKIANKCQGLPLAAKTLGSVLRFKNSLEEWENVLNDEIWQLERAEVELFPHLLLSYNDLPLALKHCFSYCTVFPKDFEIDVEKLIENWIALGYLGSNIGSANDIELKGREYFDILAVRSLFQDFEKDDLDGQIKRCKMHDMVHDFAQFLSKDRSHGRVQLVGNMKATCQSCSPSLVSYVKEYRSTTGDDKEPLPNLCDCHKGLRVLRITNGNLPQEIRSLIHLRWLDLSRNKLSREDTKAICKLYNLQFLRLDSCHLKEIPWEIGNLKYLRHLDLSRNYNLKELPESICDLHELRALYIDFCDSISKFPEGIHRLITLRHIHNEPFDLPIQLHAGVAQLTGLRTLTEFYAGSGVGKLGWLKNLNHLSGLLRLTIKLTDHNSEDVVEDAREAELRKKIHIQHLRIEFMDEMDEKDESSSVRIDVINALEPHPNLRRLRILSYKGSKLPDWIASPINQLRSICLSQIDHLLSLPSLGKLPCLEDIYIYKMKELQFVGREFLGMTGIIGGDNMGIHESSSSSALVAADAANTVIAFPKLKKLRFRDCPKWKEWEDITVEEEESTALLLMPCLTHLIVENCTALTTLPHHLLLKVLSLEVLNICESTPLIQRYEDKDASAWKFISQNNARLQLKDDYSF